MKYLCLAYYDAKKFEALSGPELHALVSQCPPRDDELYATGQVLSIASLTAPSDATVIRPKNGKPWVTDGPFIETHEQLGSFFLIEARDLNEAIRVASKHPAAQLGEQVGWALELRPVEMFREQPTPGAPGCEVREKHR